MYMICYQISSLPIVGQKDKKSDDNQIVSFPHSLSPDHNATLVETLPTSEPLKPTPSTVNNNQSPVTSQGMNYINFTEYNFTSVYSCW